MANKKHVAMLSRGPRKGIAPAAGGRTRLGLLVARPQFAA